MCHFQELGVMFISIKNNMLSFEQFKVLINNIVKLYKNGCLLQKGSIVQYSFLSTTIRTVSILLTELYGSVVCYEILNYVREESEYSLEEIYDLIDGHNKLISKDSAISLWKLEELYPNDEMFKYFQKVISSD